MTKTFTGQIVLKTAPYVILALILLPGCASTDSETFDPSEPVFTKRYEDNTPLAAVESLLFAYRAGDYHAVYFLTKPTENQSAANRKAFVNEVEAGDEWTPALWQLDPNVAYTGDKASADVVASVVSDLDGYLYTDTMRFYCFLDGERWKIANHDFEGESQVLAPAESVQR